jgi:predicted ATPase/DNA-binding CsgD family transcriptional regulator
MDSAGRRVRSRSSRAPQGLNRACPSPVPWSSRRRGRTKPPLPVHNLPLQLTSFVGREREVAEVKEALQSARLLTLTGAGGCGKTRLALQVAADIAGEYDSGTWLAELAGIVDPDLVPQTVAFGLRLRDVPGQPILTTLLAYLESRSILLVLDNCEHLITAAASLIETLLRRCPKLRILATSRELLDVQGEVLYRVPSLGLPETLRSPSLEQVLSCEATRLFIDRARAMESTFTASTGNASAIARLCARLDGMPLAIELAAARVRALSVEQIAERLGDRFRLLVRSYRAAVPRHQTLRATIDWSFALLSESETALFRRLSVFAGGWTIEAAEEVCSWPDPRGCDVLGLLAQLVDKSLVVGEETPGGVRYRFLETIRQYAWERLIEAGELSGTRQRHLAWMLAVGQQSSMDMLGEAHIAAIQRLETEHGNLRAALEYCLENEPEHAVRLASCAWRFWRERGYVDEGRRWLRTGLARASDRTSERGRALIALGCLTFDEGDYAGAVPLLEHALEIFREVGDPLGASEALHDLGGCNIVLRGDAERSRQLFQEALELARGARDPLCEGWALVFLGRLDAGRRDYTRAVGLVSQGMDLIQQTGEPWSISQVLWDLGWLALALGDVSEARHHLRRMRLISQQIGDRQLAGFATLGLAMAAQAARRPDAARLLLTESLRLFRECQSPGIYDALSELGHLAIQSTDYVAGARLIVAGEASRARYGSWRILLYRDAAQARWEASLAAARRALGEKTFRRVRSAAESMTVDEAIEQALALATGRPAPVGQPHLKAGSALTAREHEVADLIAEGLSNSEIAERLVISSRTAETHVKHILDKLGFSSRAQVAAWTVRREVDDLGVSEGM